MSMDENLPSPTSSNNTYLIADCGHSTTTVALFKVVSGDYRLVSRAQVPSTITDPTPDVLIGIKAAIREVEKTTGHAILLPDGDLIRNTAQTGRGVDRFSLTTSASIPLRVAIIAPSIKDESIDSIERLLQEVSTEQVSVFAKDDDRNLQIRIDELGQMRPDLIVITHGPTKRVKNELMMLMEAVRFGQKQLAPSDRARIIYCGHADLQGAVTDVLTDEFPVIATDHIRPKSRKEMPGPLRQTIREQLQDIKLCQIPGMSRVIDWGGGERPTATVDALVDVVQYRAAVRDGNVLLIDLEQDDLILIFANRDETHIVTRPEFGVGKPLANLLDYIEIDQFFRWLPQEVEDRDALEEKFSAYLINQSFYPDMVPMVDEEFYFLQAIMRAIVTQAWQEAQQTWGLSASKALNLQTIIVRGRPLMMMPRSSQIIHLILDAIQPLGVVSVALDRYGVLPTVGKLAAQNPIAAVQTAESGVLVDLGWVVGVKGWQGRGRAVNLSLASETSKLELDADWGSIEVLPVPSTMSGDLTITPGFFGHVGNGRGRKQVLTDVGGGLVGVVADARGRPISLPTDEQKRSELISKWIVDIGG